jgi:hypothetical protein
MRGAVVLVIATVLLGSRAFAAEAEGGKAKQDASAPAKPKAAKSDDKLVCERVTEVGTLIPKRVCRTQAQIEEERRAVERMDSERQTYSGRGPGATER